MKLIYVVGPYRADSEWQLVRNIRAAEAAALAVWSAGGAALCPHKNTAMFGGANDLPDSVWLEGDLEMLSRCDGVLLAPGWRTSSGSLAEHKAALDLAIPVNEAEALPSLKMLGDWISAITSRAAKNITARSAAELVRAFVERELTRGTS